MREAGTAFAVVKHHLHWLLQNSHGKLTQLTPPEAKGHLVVSVRMPASRSYFVSGMQAESSTSQ